MVINSAGWLVKNGVGFHVQYYRVVSKNISQIWVYIYTCGAGDLPLITPPARSFIRRPYCIQRTCPDKQAAVASPTTRALTDVPLANATNNGSD